ncbi:MAG: SRPBCC family protein [Bacteroidia bacterium]
MQQHHLTRLETQIDASPEAVWQVLTDPAIVWQYFFGSELVTTWEVGSTIVFRGEWEGQPYEDKGTVLAYTHNQSLAFSYLSNWSNLPDEPDNYLHITYTVEAVGGGTRLTITQTNYDEARAAHSLENWTSVVESMKNFLPVS